MREWAVKLEAKPKYVMSSTRKDFPWTHSHHIAGDLRTGVRGLKDATPSAWHRSGDALRQGSEEGLEIGRVSESFANDVLLARSCRPLVDGTLRVSTSLG